MPDKKNQPFDKAKFENLYKWVRKRIYESEEFNQCPTAVNIDIQQAQPTQQYQPTGQPGQPMTNQQAYQPPQQPPQPLQPGDVGGNDW